MQTAVDIMTRNASCTHLGMPAAPDAALVAACNRIVALENAKRGVWAALPDTHAAERKAAPALNRLDKEIERLFKRIVRMPAPTTLAAARALAGASIALAPRDSRGAILSWDIGDEGRLAMRANEYLTNAADEASSLESLCQNESIFAGQAALRARDIADERYQKITDRLAFLDQGELWSC